MARDPRKRPIEAVHISDRIERRRLQDEKEEGLQAIIDMLEAVREDAPVARAEVSEVDGAPCKEDPYPVPFSAIKSELAEDHPHAEEETHEDESGSELNGGLAMSPDMRENWESYWYRITAKTEPTEDHQGNEYHGEEVHATAMLALIYTCPPLNITTIIDTNISIIVSTSVSINIVIIIRVTIIIIIMVTANMSSLMQVLR